MNLKHIAIVALTFSIGFSNTFSDMKKQTLNDNKSLSLLHEDTKISKHNELLSGKWKNIVLGLGANDFQLNDLSARDKEAMQNQFISLTQTIPMGSKLKYKKNIENTNGKITALLLEDKKAIYSSSILEYLNEYVITQKEVWLLSSLKTNINKIIQLQKQKFKLTSSEQIDIINSDTSYVKYDLQRDKSIYKLDIIKLKLQNITYNNVNKIKHTLSKQIIPSVNINELLLKNNMYKALLKRILKSEQNISLQNSLFTNDIKVKIAYYKRDKFEDYLSFSLAYPLSIYGSEDIAVEKSKINNLKTKYMLSKFENEFRIKLKTILLDMKLANSNYNNIITKVIAQKKFVNHILESQSAKSKVNTIKQLMNQNSIIKESLKAINEQKKFFKAKAKLTYYQGDTL